MQGPHVELGLGSWTNHHHGDRLHPPDTPRDEQLARYAHHFTLVEASRTFHEVPSPWELDQWVDATPAGFRFHPKLPRFLTEGLERDAEAVMDEVVHVLDDLGPLKESAKLGTLVVQLPPSLEHDDHNRGAVADLLKALRDWHRDVAVEFRHESWWTAEVETLLEAQRVALVWSTWDDAPAPSWVTADHGYVRLVGTRRTTRIRPGTPPTVEARDADLHRISQDLQGVGEATWKRCPVICSNRFEGDALATLHRAAAALDARDPLDGVEAGTSGPA